jgi:hypothetical protein
MNNDPSPLDAWFRSVDALLAEDAGVPDQPVLFEEEGKEPPELIGKLWGTLRKERDLELHVRGGLAVRHRVPPAPRFPALHRQVRERRLGRAPAPRPPAGEADGAAPLQRRERREPPVTYYSWFVLYRFKQGDDPGA